MDIPWDQLTPASLPGTPALLQGSMGIVLRGTWHAPRRAPRSVAVKVLKGGFLFGSASVASALEALQSEADAMVAASDGGRNEFVMPLLGLARGPTPRQWLEALGAAGALACELQGGAGGGGGGSGGGGGQLFALVMPWEEGGSLRDLLHDPRRAWAAGTGDRLLLCAQIASGLSGLHCCSRGALVHGDIKTENVLLSHLPGASSAPPRPRVSVS